MQTPSWHNSLGDRTCDSCPFSGKRLRTSSLKYTPNSLQRPHWVKCRNRTYCRYSNRNLDIRQNSFCPHITAFLFTIASINTWSPLKEHILALFTCSPFYSQRSLKKWELCNHAMHICLCHFLLSSWLWICYSVFITFLAKVGYSCCTGYPISGRNVSISILEKPWINPNLMSEKASLQWPQSRKKIHTWLISENQKIHIHW